MMALPPFRWTDAELDTLRRMQEAGAPQALIAATLNRSPRAVCARLARNGKPKAAIRPHKPWFGEELERLRRMVDEDRSIPEIAASLGRTRGAVRIATSRAGLRPRDRRADGRLPHHRTPVPVPWGKSQIETLMDMWSGGAPVEKVAAATGHSVSAVWNKTSVLGIGRGSSRHEASAGRRTCSNCSKPFWAASKFVRRCEACHDDD